MCARRVLTEEGKKNALQHEAERAAADAKQEAVQAKSSDQALSTLYAQEVGRRPKSESHIACLQQNLQQVVPQKLLEVHVNWHMSMC